MNCGYCKDCAHWLPGGIWGMCDVIDAEEKGADRAVIDASDLAVLRTKPDFGCVQFEASA